MDYKNFGYKFLVLTISLVIFDTATSISQTGLIGHPQQIANSFNTQSPEPTFYSENIEVLDSWKLLPPKLIDVKGDTVYYYFNNRIVVSDYSDRNYPNELSSLDISQFASGLNENSYLDEDLLVVSTKDNQILIIDISDLTNITILSSIRSITRPYHLQIENDILYTSSLTTESAHLYAIDISNRNSPVISGHFENYFEILKLDISNKIAYILMKNGGYSAIDLNDPSIPIELSNYSTEQKINSVVFYNNYAYLYEKNTGIHTVDYSIPESPVFINIFPLIGLYDIELDIVNNLLQIKSNFRHYFYSLSNPYQLTYVKDEFLYYRNGKFSGDYYYFEDPNSGIGLVDFTDWKNPVDIYVRNIDFPSGVKYFGIYDGYIFGTLNENVTKVYDQNDFRKWVTTIINDNNISSSFIHKNYLYQSDRRHIYRTDISDPLGPRIEGSIYEMGENINSTISKSDEKLIYFSLNSITDRTITIFNFDLNNMSQSPISVKYPIDNEPGIYFVHKDKVYFMNDNKEYNVIDITTGVMTTNRPDTIPSNSVLSRITSYKNQLYAASNDSLITIFSVNSFDDIEKIRTFDPAEDKFFGSHFLRDIKRLSVDNDYLYVGDKNGFIVYDVINPGLPVRVGYFTLSDRDPTIKSFVVENGIIALSTLNNGNYLLKTNFSEREKDIITTPKDFVLYNNFPNPFNPETFIKFSLEKSAKIKLEIYNSIGQKVKTLVNTTYDSGLYYKKWDGTNNLGIKVASGTYYYNLRINGKSTTKKMLLIK